MGKKKLRFKEGDKVYWIEQTDFMPLLHEGEIVATDGENGRHVCVDILKRALGLQESTFVLPDGDENYHKTKREALRNPPAIFTVSED